MKIHIEKYPVFMKLGYFVGERIRGQEVLVSLEVELKKEKSFQDELELTTDYGKILEKVDLILRDKEMKLIETAVEKTGEDLLKHFPQINRLHVHIEKPLLPDGIGRGSRVSVSENFSRD